MKNFTLFTITLLLITSSIFSQRKLDKLVPDYSSSMSSDKSLSIEFIKRLQNFDPNMKSTITRFDIQISSPKSVIFSHDGRKFYIHALEGYATSVYDSSTLKRIKVIKHLFKSESPLFKNDDSFINIVNPAKVSNTFNGKPVESCLTHDGKYLWVTYYRRSYDTNALLPSALAIIDTEIDSIIRVMPTDPLPKMIRYNSTKKIVAVTHWGNNTVGIIDVRSSNPENFEYTNLIPIGKKYTPETGSEEKINRDKYCGHCLRGTVFTKDGKYLFVGRMSGGGISIIDCESFEVITTITGMKRNVRHLLIQNNRLYLSSNSDGYIQYKEIDDIMKVINLSSKKFTNITNWKSKYIGNGARTFDITTDQKYIFATVNNSSKIVYLNPELKILGEIPADSYPVGLAISPDNTLLISTSQGKNKVGGNSVNIFKITYN